MSWWLDLALMLSLIIALLHMLMIVCYLIKSMTISCKARLLISRNKLIFKFLIMWALIFILVITNLSLNHVLKLKWKIAILINEFACLTSHIEIKKILNETYSVFYFLRISKYHLNIQHKKYPVALSIHYWYEFAIWLAYYII